MIILIEKIVSETEKLSVNISAVFLKLVKNNENDRVLDAIKWCENHPSSYHKNSN